MKTQIKGRNVTVTEPLRQYAEEKLERVHKLLMQRRIDEVTRVELELMVEKNPSIPEPCLAEATMFTRGPVMRAREASADMYAAIDLVTDKLMRRVKKYHDKVHGKTRHGPRQDAHRRRADPRAGPGGRRRRAFTRRSLGETCTPATTGASSRRSSSPSSRCRFTRRPSSWSWSDMISSCSRTWSRVARTSSTVATTATTA